MKPISFLRGVVIALVLALGVSILFSVLTTLTSSLLALRLLIPAAGGTYLLFLLAHSPQRSGKITALFGWAVAATCLWFFIPGVALYLTLHGLLMWAIRSLCLYRNLLAPLLDLTLTMGSLAAAVWAGQHTGSLFLSVWSLFLVQALFVYIPQYARARQPKRVSAGATDNFSRAAKNAEAALRRLAADG